MLTTNNDGAALLAPGDVGALLVQPMQAESVAAQVATVVTISSSTYRVPLITADPTAAWVNEGQEIAVSDAELDELTVRPSKVAGLSIISRELADDTSPEAADTVGEGLARDIARRVDQAFFGHLAAPAPAGLGSLTPSLADSHGWANVDAFAGALSIAEHVGAEITSWVAGPAVALTLATVKQGTGSNVPLLGADPTSPTRRSILGVPLYVSPAVADNTVWAIPAARAQVVIRDDATIERDDSAFFTSDRVAVRARMRVGFAFPHPAAIVKIAPLS